MKTRTYIIKNDDNLDESIDKLQKSFEPNEYIYLLESLDDKLIIITKQEEGDKKNRNLLLEEVKRRGL